jgi:YVTN family beta-propeller protein
MKSDSSMRRPSFLTRGYAALWAALALAVGLGATPTEAAPFAYVANQGSNNVSVIDTATNKVVTTIGVGFGPEAIAVTPDGNHAYVVGGGGFGSSGISSGTVSVIDTATNTVVAMVPVGAIPRGVAVTPDGTHAYVASWFFSPSVSVIDTATNTVVATVPLSNINPIAVAVTPNGKYAYVAGGVSGHPPTAAPTPTVFVIDTASNTVVAEVTVGEVNNPYVVISTGVAITPDGKQVYVTNSFPLDTVSVIDTASNTVVATVPVGGNPGGVAVTPDGTRAYVTGSNTVSVIATAADTVVASVPVAGYSSGVAVTPGGKQVYVTNSFPVDTVSVIDTASNTVVATVPVGDDPGGVGIIPPPPGTPFSAFSAKLEIHSGHKPNTDHFYLNASFTLGSTSNGIHPFAEPVTLKVGTFTATIPPASFKIADDQDDQNDREGGVGMKKFGPFRFHGVIDGVDLRVLIRPTGAKRYALEAEARHADLTGTKNPVAVTLAIGDDSGTVSVKAHIDQKLTGRDDD